MIIQGSLRHIQNVLLLLRKNYSNDILRLSRWEWEAEVEGYLDNYCNILVLGN